jgi:hypothetical protein
MHRGRIHCFLTRIGSQSRPLGPRTKSGQLRRRDARTRGSSCSRSGLAPTTPAYHTLHHPCRQSSGVTLHREHRRPSSTNRLHYLSEAHRLHTTGRRCHACRAPMDTQPQGLRRQQASRQHSQSGSCRPTNHALHHNVGSQKSKTTHHQSLEIQMGVATSHQSSSRCTEAHSSITSPQPSPARNRRPARCPITRHPGHYRPRTHRSLLCLIRPRRADVVPMRRASPNPRTYPCRLRAAQLISTHPPRSLSKPLDRSPSQHPQRHQSPDSIP